MDIGTSIVFGIGILVLGAIIVTALMTRQMKEMMKS